MAVYKIFPSADATIYSAYPAKNAGRDEVLEVSAKNSRDSLRFTDRSLLDESPFYTYDLAVSDNYTIPSFVAALPDVRRSLLQFSNEDINRIKTFASQSISGSWEAALKLNLAFAQNLNTTYSLEAYAVSQSWSMGTGKYVTTPEIRNGVCWMNTGPYQTSPLWNTIPFTPLNWETALATWEEVFTTWEWDPAPTLASGGGSWHISLAASQSFDYMSNKDVNMNITSVVGAWLNGSAANYGIIVKHPQEIEEDQNSFIDLKFFSVDTHTIYPPCIELRWDDAHYYPVGTNYVLGNQFTATIANNPGTFKQGSVYKFRTSVRDTYPTRQFTTSSIYLKAKYLSQDSYWALQDVKTNEMIIDFDEKYTKLSADNVSNYFYMYMNGLEPERFYRILLKTKVYSTTYGPLSIYDNEQSLYDALSLYSAEDLALLPAEEIIVDNNLIFKVIR